MMNDERPDDLGERTKRFALRVISLCSAVGNSGPAGVIGRQLVRSGTSVGAQYREGRRARSRAEFISKLESALQELDETQYWLELLVEGGFVNQARMAEIVTESQELMSIFVASIKTAENNRK